MSGIHKFKGGVSRVRGTFSVVDQSGTRGDLDDLIDAYNVQLDDTVTSDLKASQTATEAQEWQRVAEMPGTVGAIHDKVTKISKDVINLQEDISEELANHSDSYKDMVAALGAYGNIAKTNDQSVRTWSAETRKDLKTLKAVKGWLMFAVALLIITLALNVEKLWVVLHARS